MLFLNTDSPQSSVQAWELRSSSSSPNFFFFSLVCSIILIEEGMNTGLAGSSWLFLHQWNTCVSTRAPSTLSSLCLSQPGRRCCSRSMWKEWPMTAAHLISNCSSGVNWSSWFTAISGGQKKVSNEQAFYKHIEYMVLIKALLFVHSAKPLERALLSPCPHLSSFLIHCSTNTTTKTVLPPKPFAGRLKAMLSIIQLY